MVDYKTAFSTPFGLYQFHVMPQWLKDNSLSHQSLIPKVFQYGFTSSVEPKTQLKVDRLSVVLPVERRTQWGHNCKTATGSPSTPHVIWENLNMQQQKICVEI